MFKIISPILLGVAFVATAYANPPSIISKIKQHQHHTTHHTKTHAYPDYSGHYEGSCTINDESFDGFKLTIYDSQSTLEFEDYDGIHYAYELDAASTYLQGKSHRVDEDIVDFTSVYWNEDESALIIRHTSSMKHSDTDAPQETILEKITLEQHDNHLILNANSRRFGDLDEYADAVMKCTLTKTGTL